MAVEESFFAKAVGKIVRFLVPSALRTRRVIAWLLTLTVFAAVFIPRVMLGSAAGHYSIDLRAEDSVLFLAVLLSWGMSETSEAAAWETVWIERVFLIFLGVALLSVFLGIHRGTIDKPFVSLLYVVKWCEYFLVFSLAAQLARDFRHQQLFLQAFFVLGAAAVLYGFFEYFRPDGKAVYPNYYRLFERPPFHGDANHMGGLISLWMALAAGVCFTLRQKKWAVLAGAGVLAAFFPLIWTFSRKSYFALAGALSLAIFLPIKRRRWLWLLALMVCAGLLLPTRLVSRVADLGEVLTETDPYHSSWAGNLDMWRRSFVNFDKLFFFGAGLGARHRLFYESQYVLIVSETGVVGALAYAALVGGPGLLALRRLRKTGRETLRRGLWIGWLLGWVVILLHSFSCVSLTISKMAIPWWFLTGTLFSCPESAEFSE